MAYNLKEWPLASLFTNPFQIAASKDAAFFIDGAWVGPGLGRIGRLNPAADLVTTWLLPLSSSSPGDIEVQGGQSSPNAGEFVYISDVPGSSIVRFSPSNNQFTKWPLPTGMIGGPRHFGFDSSGHVYFSVSSTSHLQIGRLDPSKNVITTWPLTTSLVNVGSNWVEDVVVDSKGNVFFAILGATSPPANNKICRLNPTTNLITAWPVPNTPNFAIEVNAAGQVFFEEVLPSGARKMARLTPGSNTLTEWIFSGNATEFIAIVPGGKVFVADPTHNAIVRLDPSVPGAKRRLVPFTVRIDPLGAQAKPDTGKARPTNTRVTSTVTSVAGTTAGAFTTVVLPTAFSLPRGITANYLGRVYFTEQGTDKIGLLT
jgi:streptogramin lyase